MDKKLIINNGRIITPDGIIEGFLVIENGKIKKIGQNSHSQNMINCEAKVIDAQGNYISPGFIDIHTHGGGGHDFMDGTVESFAGACRFHRSHGTTTIVPTTVTSTNEELYNTLKCFRMAKKLENMPEMPGLHLEGPYFSMQYCGAQDPKYIKNPNEQEYREILEAADGDIIRWSVAPELEGSLRMGEVLRENGIVASIAHSAAEYQQVEAAFRHGYTLITHFYNAMSTITRRNGFRHLGVIESGYIIDALDVEIIADSCHLPPELLGMIYKFKGAGRIALITDSMRGAGMPSGETIIGSLTKGQKAIIEDGVAKLPDRTAFAGSVATTDRLVRVMHKTVGVSITDAVKMASSTPARIIGVNDRKGHIAVGMDADILIFDDNINIKTVIVGGEQ